jgi:hypothetical protein
MAARKSTLEAISMDVEGSSEIDNWLDNGSITGSDCENKTHKDIDWLQKTTEELSLQRLSPVLDEKSPELRFCCGGTIELEEDETVTISWGYSSQGELQEIKAKTW